MSACDGEDVHFTLLDFPDKEEYSQYLSAYGHTSESYREAVRKWGENDLRMEIPSFMELFVEHATAPFFVFQVRSDRHLHSRCSRCCCGASTITLASRCSRW